MARIGRDEIFPGMIKTIEAATVAKMRFETQGRMGLDRGTGIKDSGVDGIELMAM
jgi:hypothetical protein